VATYTPSDNFQGSSDSSKKLTITTATLTVTAADKTSVYSDTIPPYTVSYTGFVNGENLASSGVDRRTERHRERHVGEPGGPVHDYPIPWIAAGRQLLVQLPSRQS
jgi:hypothetical protein